MLNLDVRPGDKIVIDDNQRGEQIVMFIDYRYAVRAGIEHKQAPDAAQAIHEPEQQQNDKNFVALRINASRDIFKINLIKARDRNNKNRTRQED